MKPELTGTREGPSGGMSLITRSTEIAILSSNILNSFAAQILWGIQEESLDGEYDLNLYFSNAASAKGGAEYFCKKIIRDKRAAALITIAYRLEDKFINDMIAAGIAPVVIDNAAAGAYSLITDNENSAYEAVKHLTKFSRNKRIGIVLGGGYSAINLNIQSQRERLSGYKRALAENSMPFDESLIWYIQNFNYQAGKDAFRFMLSSNVDAVFCAAGDYVALGFLSEARLQGVSIPGSMSIVGFDDIEIAKDLDLTTVRQPLEEMGREAFKTAVEAVTSHELRGTVKEFKNTLILRNTA